MVEKVTENEISNLLGSWSISMMTNPNPTMYLPERIYHPNPEVFCICKGESNTDLHFLRIAEQKFTSEVNFRVF